MNVHITLIKIPTGFGTPVQLEILVQEFVAEPGAFFTPPAGYLVSSIEITGE